MPVRSVRFFRDLASPKLTPPVFQRGMGADAVVNLPLEHASAASGTFVCNVSFGSVWVPAKSRS